MKKLMLGGLLSLTLVSSAMAGGDIEAGKSKADMFCKSCHGANGISGAPIWPNLAGQKAAYLEKQLKAFQSGKRSDPSMDAMAKLLTPEDVVNVAAYYESLK